MSEHLGIYLHVPFCVRRCAYCAFYSIEGAPQSRMAAYPRLILAELKLRAAAWRAYTVGSVYIGGGTPSLLPPQAFGEILGALHAEFNVSAQAEITLEANPGTITADSLSGYRDAGVNRISLGLQALDDERLIFLGRIHTRREAIEALKLAAQAGYHSISVDLLFGSSLETAASWQREFDELLQHSVQHISFYSLTLEEDTRLMSRADRGEKVSLRTDETVDLMLQAAAILAAASFEHYEVSNWAKSGHECRHNLHYWQRGHYLGLGPSAHSFDGSKRSWNMPDLDAYTAALKSASLPPSDGEILASEEVRTEWVYLQLRQRSGLDLRCYGDLFGPAPRYWITMLEALSAKGLGEFVEGGFLPNDRGLLLADEVAARLLT